MVWGVIFPGSWGKHNPESSVHNPFPAQLEKNFAAMPREKQALYNFRAPTYLTAVSELLTKDPNRTRAIDALPLRPLEENEWPSEYRLKKRYENLASIIEAGSATRRFLVDETLKVLIERLEPGVHQFRPIALTMPKGAVYPVQYYTIVFGNWVDSFSPELSDQDCYHLSTLSYFVENYTKHDMAGLALSRQRFGTFHFWREKKLRVPEICISETLYDHIIRAGQVLPKHFKMREV